MAEKSEIAGQSVDSYLEYRRIVGNDDNGKLFTDKEYEQYKARVIPIRMKNRLFTSWSNGKGIDCKLIGPDTLCFCSHRYKEHKTDFEKIPEQRPILLPCKVNRCRCLAYKYIPLINGVGIRCTCKHIPTEHDAREPCKCLQKSCQSCTGFKSSYTCACKTAYSDHMLVVETKEERLARGLPVGKDTPYQAMGGITGFSSLADGVERYDPSGIGALSEEFMNQDISEDDHPFLRMAATSIKALNSNGRDEGKPDETSFQMRRDNESEFDYYERKYKEKNKITHGPPRHNTNR